MESLFVLIPPVTGVAVYEDASVISCGNPIIKELIGCCDGVPGLMHSEHSMLCSHFSSQSPQRLKMIAQYMLSQIMSGEQVLKKGYKLQACTLMESEELDDTQFLSKWTAFITQQEQVVNEFSSRTY